MSLTELSLSENPYLDRRIKEYLQIKRHKEQVEKRLNYLNQQIKKELAEKDKKEYVNFNKDCRAVLQVKKTKPVPDELALEILLQKKGLWDKAKKEVIDHNLVKQLYIEGELTDDDLREIIAEPKIITALIVEEVNDVQTDDDRIC